MTLPRVMVARSPSPSKVERNLGLDLVSDGFSSPRKRAMSPDTFPSPAITFRADTPPPAPNTAKYSSGGLQEALRSFDVDRVRQVLETDRTTALMPMFDDFGYEMPIVKAARRGCPMSIFKLLLQHGASVDEPPSSRYTTALAALAMGCTSTMPQHLSARGLLPVFLPPLGNPIDLTAVEAFLPHVLVNMPQDDDEQTRLKVACLLFVEGADLDRVDLKTAKTAADLAEANGRHRLSAFLRTADGRRCCWFLKALWTRRDALLGRGDVPSHHDLLDLPNEPRSLLCSFLVV
jgi:hypothetical protein